MDCLFPINLLIAVDHQLVIDGLSNILHTEKMIGKIYTANNGRIALNKVMSNDIDCVLMDVNIPALCSIEATKLIKKENSCIKVIIVSMLSNGSIANELLKAGADGFINKETGKNDLLKAIGKVMKNKKPISPEITNNLFLHFNGRKSVGAKKGKYLTSREIEILQHIANGLTNKNIANKLFLSIATVSTHRKNMLAKLQLNNTASLVKYGAEHRLL